MSKAEQQADFDAASGADEIERERRSQRPLRLARVELADANAFVERLHRHHKKIQGHRFSLGAETDEGLCGVAIVGRPVGGQHLRDWCVPVPAGQDREVRQPKECWEMIVALADHWLAKHGDAPPGSVLATCPKCERANNDFDGFGVLKCDFCDYCTHPSITDNTCDLCKTDCTPRAGGE